MLSIGKLKSRKIVKLKIIDSLNETVGLNYLMIIHSWLQFSRDYRLFSVARFQPNLV